MFRASRAPLLFLTVIGAWALMPVLKGRPDFIDAGCAFNHVALGVLTVVDLAGSDPGLILR
ncbi:MAG TPA: hypothetical protein VK869_00645 [Rubrobacteraceae bacterium]|nr:hypothetical protein [Rubrobacteraceae bacterium]